MPYLAAAPFQTDLPLKRQNDGDCSSVVEPRIVIPVVAGSIPVSHPIFTIEMMAGCILAFPRLAHLLS